MRARKERDQATSAMARVAGGGSWRLRARDHCFAVALALTLPGVTGRAEPNDAGFRGGPVSGAPAVPLIPRAMLLGSPQRLLPQLSPDGRRLAWLSPDERDAPQLHVRTAGQRDDTRLTQHPGRGLRDFRWAEDSATLLYTFEAGGDGNTHIYSAELASGNLRDLTPWVGVRAELLATAARFADQALITLNLRDRRWPDVHRVNLRTGAVELDTQNPGDVEGWVVDPLFVVRGAWAVLKDGSTELRIRDAKNAPWRALVTASLEERLAFHGFALDGRSVYLTTSISSDTARLVEKGVKTGTERAIAQSAGQDLGSVWWQPTRHVPLAARFDVEGKPAWTVLDYGLSGDFKALQSALGTASFTVQSTDRAETTWILVSSSDVEAPRYWSWERKSKRLSPLFSAHPALDGVPLVATKPITIPRVGPGAMPAYLTVPEGSAGPRPLVLLVRADPWARDFWGFDAGVQFLANRGYAVLQVNARGAGGYGKRYLAAGDQQWGGVMQDDLTAAVLWAIDAGVADASRVAIMGAGYGGYATLAGLTASTGRELYRCGVDLMGPSNLFTLAGAGPSAWEPRRAALVRRLGDPSLPADRETLALASPLFSAERITVPLLFAHGALDTRSKTSESEQLFQILDARNVPTTFVLYPDEHGGLTRLENRLDFHARVEAHLARCLGGRAEPMVTQGSYPGSTATVRLGRASSGP